jgi:hypothetical protein
MSRQKKEEKTHLELPSLIQDLVKKERRVVEDSSVRDDDLNASESADGVVLRVGADQTRLRSRRGRRKEERTKRASCWFQSVTSQAMPVAVLFE